MDSCLSVLKPTELYGKGHPYHDLPNDEKIDLAIRKAIELRKERKTGPLPREINTNWNFGWAMVVAWKYIEDLEGQGIVPTFEDVKTMFDYYASKEIPVKEETTMAEVAATETGLMEFTYENRTVRTTFEDGRPWWVAKDVCEILGYSDASLTNMRTVLDAVPDEWKGRKRITTLGGEQEMWCLTEEGLFFFLARSDKPKALPFQKWNAGEVLPAVRRTGTYSTPAALKEKADKSDELMWKRLEVMERNSKIRAANAIFRLMDKADRLMTDESRKILCYEAAKMLSGQEVTNILPEPTGETYSADDLAKEFGTSRNRIGRISNQHGLKCPKGERGEYGEWRMSKSQNGPTEVDTFRYNEKGREWFRNFFNPVASTGTEGK